MSTLDEDELSETNGSQRHFIFGLIMAIVTALVFFIWVAIPVLNSQFVYGYPRIASLPGPNAFVDTRSTVFTVFIGLLAINGLLPYLLITALQENKIGEFGAVHVFVSGLSVFINFIVFLFLAVTWFISCNNGLGVTNTACHDPRYCCSNFAVNSAAMDLCPNNGMCTPDVVFRDLSASGPYQAHFWFSLIFLVTAWLHIAVNRRLVVYRALEV